MIKITYRGPQSYMRVETPYNNEYLFSAENGFTTTPSTWLDLYFILSLDQSFNARNFVFAKDPESEKTDRRIPTDTSFIDPNILANQLVNEEKEAERKIYKEAKERFVKAIYDRISLGTLEEIPEDIEAKADEYAEKALEAFVANRDAAKVIPVELPEDTSTDEPEANACITDEPTYDLTKDSEPEQTTVEGYIEGQLTPDEIYKDEPNGGQYIPEGTTEQTNTDTPSTFPVDEKPSDLPIIPTTDVPPETIGKIEDEKKSRK